jgi:hypothetical protein
MLSTCFMDSHDKQGSRHIEKESRRVLWDFDTSTQGVQVLEMIVWGQPNGYAAVREPAEERRSSNHFSSFFERLAVSLGISANDNISRRVKIMLKGKVVAGLK